MALVAFPPPSPPPLQNLQINTNTPSETPATRLKPFVAAEMSSLVLALIKHPDNTNTSSCPLGDRIKAGVHMKMLGKSDFLFSLELASSTIGLHIGKSCFGVFSKFKCEVAVYIQEVYEMWLVATAT